jgi:hypothetical protein
MHMHRAQITGANNFRTIRVQLMEPHIRWLIDNSNLPANPSDAEIANIIGCVFDQLVAYDDENQKP